ncbi:MAG: hypothetical protein VZR06_09445 [Butyrivibrio sp.]|nr:hypothetical protein [Butyrivibrio sp.]
MSKLAICVPTYNRPDVVEEILLYSAEYLKKHDVDMYYYDSGDTGDVEALVDKHNLKGYDNVHYIRVPSDYLYGDKIDLIYSGEGLKKEYDYIWPIKERIIPNERMLELVLERCDGEADAIISLTLGDIYEGDTFDFHSPVDVYRYFGKQTTSLETVIYNTKTMLGDYVFGESKNSAKHKNDFWHYWFLYDKLSKLDNPVIAVVSKDGAYNMQSSVPAGNNWRKRIFEVWIEEFIKINFELPDIYSAYKTQVIKNTVSIEELLGSRNTFVELHNEGILTAEVFDKYKDFWTFVTDVPVEEIKKISCGEM